MRLLVAGLSRTGTSSVHEACLQLGLRSIHNDMQRLDAARHAPMTDFRIYDDIDVVSDIPSALFFSELADAYPDAVVLLTTRDEQRWWESVVRYHLPRTAATVMRARERMRFVTSPRFRRVRRRERLRDEWRIRAYGTAIPDETIWRAAFRAHNEAVRRSIDADRLIEADVTAGAGWGPLCEALGVAVPETDFPHANRSGSMGRSA